MPKGSKGERLDQVWSSGPPGWRLGWELVILFHKTLFLQKQEPIGSSSETRIRGNSLYQGNIVAGAHSRSYTMTRWGRSHQDTIELSMPISLLKNIMKIGKWKRKQDGNHGTKWGPLAKKWKLSVGALCATRCEKDHIKCPIMCTLFSTGNLSILVLPKSICEFLKYHN